LRKSKILRKNLEEIVLDPHYEEDQKKEVIKEEALNLAMLGNEIMEVLKRKNPENLFIENLREEINHVSEKLEDEVVKKVPNQIDTKEGYYKAHRLAEAIE
jgi:hypothetical protein